MDFLFSLPFDIAILYLIIGIFKHKSYVGISAKTQLLYTVALVAVCDIPLLLLALLTMLAFALSFKMGDTYEKDADSFWTEILLTAAFILSVFVHDGSSSYGILSAFGEYLESVAFIPQLYMIWNSKTTTKEMKVYVYFLFLYKLLNILPIIYIYWVMLDYNIRYSVVVMLNFLILFIAVLTVRSKKIILPSQDEKIDTKAQNIFIVTSGIAPSITATKPEAVPDAKNEVNKPSLV
ncbi:ER lumen protein-retaining receptor isoform X4 [Diabrotica virgifera virgifera]|uniref:Uncharacterized protein n=1 Tax=Diabrotica virgifera virgifera TaxID=50390 RepID=A0ABM5JR27_DIAVI|nr:ER lumen protein-retaining receptor isoform X4 [Diabrotica virgifera virgifera]